MVTLERVFYVFVSYAEIYVSYRYVTRVMHLIIMFLKINLKNGIDLYKKIYVITIRKILWTKIICHTPDKCDIVNNKSVQKRF